MLVTLGVEDPPDLAGAVTGGAADRFVARFMALGNRRDRARNAAEFVAALAATDGEIINLGDIAARAPRPGAYKRFRQLLDGQRWAPDVVRRDLVATLPVGRIEALLVEFTETRSGEIGWDTFSLHALGPGIARPIGWRRVITASAAAGFESENLSEAERGALLGLLADARLDLQASFGLALTELPVLTVDICFGQCAQTRSALADLGFETFLEVGPAFADLDFDRDPFEAQTPRLLGDQLPIGEDAVPGPREILWPDGRRGDVVVPHVRSGDPGWAIARPRIESSHGLTGRRRLDRALELRDLSDRLVPLAAARRLRLGAFHHQSDAGWMAAATLVSAAYAAQVSGSEKEEVS